MPRGPTPIPAIVRWLRFVPDTSLDGCWEWKGHRNRGGYGTFCDSSGRDIKSHRFAYEHFVEDIQPGLVIDHLCRNRGCQNPSHMRAVTQRENIMASPIAVASLHARKTCCGVCGGPYEQTALARRCRRCSYKSIAKYQLKMKARKA